MSNQITASNSSLHIRQMQCTAQRMYWVLLILNCMYNISTFRRWARLNSKTPLWVAAQEMRWSGIPMDACSSSGCCSKSCDLLAAFTPCNTWSSVAPALEGGGCDQSIGSTVSDAILRSWLCLTATRSSPLGYFSILLSVVYNWPYIFWS